MSQNKPIIMSYSEKVAKAWLERRGIKEDEFQFISLSPNQLPIGEETTGKVIVIDSISEVWEHVMEKAFDEDN